MQVSLIDQVRSQLVLIFLKFRPALLKILEYSCMQYTGCCFIALTSPKVVLMVPTGVKEHLELNPESTQL